MNRGYIRLWRKSLDNDLIRNPGAWQLMSWCLLKATHRHHRQIVGAIVVELKPGQLIFGRATVARELGTTERKIRTCLDLLQKVDFLTIKATNKFSVITIVNWNSYQEERPANDQQDDQQATSKRPANDHKQEHKTQSTEEEKNPPNPPDGGGEGVAAPPPEPPSHLGAEIMREYNAVLTELKPAVVMSTAMSRDLAINRRDHPERRQIDFWVGLFHKARASPHLAGKTKGSNWKASLPWLLRPDNVDKILNGAYDNASEDRQGSQHEKNIKALQAWKPPTGGDRESDYATD